MEGLAARGRSGDPPPAPYTAMDEPIARVGNVERLRKAVANTMHSVPPDMRRTHERAHKMLKVPIHDAAMAQTLTRHVRQFNPNMIEALYFALHRLLSVCEASRDLGLTPETFLRAWVKTREGRVTQTGVRAVTWMDALEDYMAIPNAVAFREAVDRATATKGRRCKARSMRRAEVTLCKWWQEFLRTIRSTPPPPRHRQAHAEATAPFGKLSFRTFVCAIVRTLREAASTRALIETIDSNAIRACCDHVEPYFDNTPRPEPPSH